MATKIEIVGSALVISDTLSSEILADLPKREVYIDVKELINYDVIKFRATGDNTKAESIPSPVLLSVAVNASAVAYNEATFLAFARANLGS